jgi:phage terminase large subunit
VIDEHGTERVVIPYTPRPLQRAIHTELGRFGVLVCHRRFGKTVLAINEVIKRVASCPLPLAQGHYVAPYYGQVKRIAWKYMQQFTRGVPGIDHNQSELLTTFPNGATIQLLGGDNIDSHRGIYSDYAVLDEYAQMHPALWGEIFRPALSDRKGGALFIGTPKGHNGFFDKWEQAGTLPNWYRKLITVTESGALDAEEIEAARREMTEAEFAQEYLCSFEAAIKGAFFAKEIAAIDQLGKITSVPHDPNLPCVTSWDLGISDATVVHVWQFAGREIRLINTLAYQGTGLPAIVKDLNTLPYMYIQHIFPHDVRVRELGSGKSRVDTLAGLGVDCDIAPNLSIADGIQAVRSIIPRMIIDRENCSVTIEAFRQYRTEYDERKQVFRESPLHDWTSDYMDAVRMLAVTPINSLDNSWNHQQSFDEFDRSVI